MFDFEINVDFACAPLQYLRVGRAFLVRGKAGRNDSQPARPSFLHTNDFSTSGSSNVPLQLLAEQLPYLESVCHATSVGAMAILVGPPSVGKTSLVRALARLAGQNLCELTLTSTSDTSDLLGGFEQVDTTRKLKELTATAQARANDK